ncbi:hypothetical protein SDRG_11819 [Saprolegnia diclina VS20]|uniref:Uncharacterized protein n=1 Tax=Saprolegnia diclina (strain VS20) TaxID=1156394 RepID=T0RE16_SAPDV|nr:hypothetical protein SDRG_11819 [Saprolegnia diclina VS20]EQC30503.1 hypothetical protein SDRG_11819 [Saprolegnia diclina VS20]|eukprot:XP_008616096.1 hypothetical protein SDRG_11819 [Saprolegnia diclina VS20]
MRPRCFAADEANDTAACAVHHWDDCGYGWLHLAPILICLCLWVLVGVWMLRPHVTLHGLLRSDAAGVHDPIAQGIAIALSQRKYRSLRQQRVQRAVRLLAMWVELPEFALVPLELAFRITGQPDGVEALMAILEFASEGSTIVMSLVCGSAMLLFHWSKRCHVFLDRIVHPLALDLFYIPMITAFLRLGTCPMSGEHVVLPGGIACDCVDRFGYFWALGLISFVLLYRSALHHKMNVEPLATTMDFRFQPSYQFFIVMARTLSPIMSIVASNVIASRNGTIGLLTGLLFVWSFLLEYSYRTQPCIGSGRVPNNIRVLAFSSAIYTTLASIGVLTTDASISTLLWTLVPLPIIGVAAWKINDRRARLFHIPNVSIVELLRDESPAIQLVGVVAALYANPNRVVQTDHEKLLVELRRLAHGPMHTSLCRLYALRTLWFSHIESFATLSRVTGDAKTAVPPKYWLKDRANNDRPPRRSYVRHKYVKLTADNIVLQPRLVAPRSSISFMLSDMQQRIQSQKKKQIASVRCSTNTSTTAPNDTTPCYIVVICDSPWLSLYQPPDDAIATANDLFRLALDIWTQSIALHDRVAMRECALFLLQWYRTGHLYLQPVMYLQILSALCMVGTTKHIIDATHSLYNATLDKVTPVIDRR